MDFSDFPFKKVGEPGVIVFHGGCNKCTQQLIHGVDFCYNCQFFEADWSKPDLNNRKPTKAEIVRKEVKERMKNLRRGLL